MTWLHMQYVFIFVSVDRQAKSSRTAAERLLTLYRWMGLQATKQVLFYQTISGRTSQFWFTLREVEDKRKKNTQSHCTAAGEPVHRALPACLPRSRACGPKKPVTFFLTAFRGSERRLPLTSVRDLASVPTSVKVFLNVLRKSRFSSQCCSRSGTERTY